MHDKASFCIEFDDAGVSRGGHIIWQHGTFRIPQGSVTAIVGTNGTGKTTMMKAELGLIPIAHGGITVLGKPAGAMNHRIGYVPQSYASDIESNITAEQSVLLGLTGARFGIHPITRLQKDKVRNALEFVGMSIQVVAHDLNMLLPILTGAVYLLDGHPHYAKMNEVLDSKLLTHLYGTTVQVVTTPQGDMFVTPSEDEPDDIDVDAHAPEEIARFHRHNRISQEA